MYSCSNAPRVHFKVQYGNRIMVRGITTKSPSDSPNTDSVSIANSQEVIVRDSHLEGGEVPNKHEDLMRWHEMA